MPTAILILGLASLALAGQAGMVAAAAGHAAMLPLLGLLPTLLPLLGVPREAYARSVMGRDLLTTL